jgi:glucosamine--fructose-6-phosphate aminotransferase (isomerizing)
MRAEQSLLFAEAAEAAAVADRQMAGLDAPMRALGERLRDLDPPLVLTCARGSSDHAATFAKYLIETRALTPVASYAPSISSLYGTPWRKLKGTLFLAISQSGQSPDIILSARAAREAGALVVAICNDPLSPLAEAAEVTLPMLAGPERSVAATKTFIASLFAILQLVAAWTDEEELHSAVAAVPQILRQAWQLDWSPAIPALAGAQNLYVLGRGLNLGIAQEIALKLKEACGLHAEAFSAAEVRHGPMALVGPAFPVLMLAPGDEGQAAFGQVAGDFLGLGAPVVMAGAEQPGAVTLPTLPGLHPAVAPLAAIQSFYRLVPGLSLARGLDPDHPPHLRKVTETR